MRFLQRILFLILLALPIVDKLYELEENSPAVLIRAVVAVLMALMLAPLVVQHISDRKNALVRHTFLLIIYMACITLINDNGFNSAYAFIRVIYPLIGFLLIYYLTKYSILDEKMFVFFFFIITLIYCVISFSNLGYRIESYRGLSFADNTGYALLSLLASTLLFSKKKTLFPFLIFFIIVGILVCGKRGAIVIMAITAVPLIKFLLINYSRNSLRTILLLFFCVIAFIAAIYLFGEYFDASFARFQKLEEDGGSGRNQLYLLYLHHFWESDFIHQIFGHGLHAGVWGKGHRFSFIHLLAHNDWLEMLFDFGIIGCLIYLLVFVDIMRQLWQSRNNKDVHYYMLMIAFLAWLGKSLISSTFLMSPNPNLFFTTAFAIAQLEKGHKPTLKS